MEIAQVLEIGRDLLTTALLITLPALLASLVVGLIVSILQAVTSVQEQTLSFAPRLIAVGVVMFFCLGWILQTGIHFTAHMLELAAGVVRSIETLVIFFSLVLARVGFFVAMLPLMGGQQTPRLVKVGLSVALAVMWSYTYLTAAGSDAVLHEAQNVAWLSWGLALAREAALGAVFGFTFSLFLVPARVAGEFITQEIGLSFASEVTMSTDGSGGPLTVILDLFATLLFFGMNVHHLFLTVLDSTFQNYPIGGAFQLPSGDLVGQATSAQEWGLVLAAPVIVCLFLTTVVLALLTRAAPQLNIYTVGFPLRLLVGFVALLVFLPQLLNGLVSMIAQFTEMLVGMA